MANGKEPAAFGAAPHERPVPRISIHAFCEFPDTGAALQRAGADRRLSKAHLTVQLGGINAAVEHYHGQITPNLLIVETKLSGAGSAGRTRPAGRGLRSGHQGGRGRPRQRRRALSRTDAPRRLGISGGAAVAAAADRSDLRPLSGSASAADRPRRDAFIGARGGAGSSTLAHNIGWCIAEDWTSTPPSSISTCRSAPLGWTSTTKPARASPTRCRRPNAWTTCLLDRLLIKRGDHLSLFTAPAALERDYDAVPEAYEAVIDAVRHSTPCVILDLPHGWPPWIKAC